ncbi:MAG: hypothetical protein EKK64_06795 [Neisseriaceae bacterium]|nr:MAG: hypothetical protein EKK64_06795 [Neisseriaceae bacterium]
MKKNLYVSFLLLLAIFSVWSFKRQKEEQKNIPIEKIEIKESEVEEEKPEEIKEEEPPKEEVKEEPEWITYPKLREVNNLGVVLSDIESHMPAGHHFVDPDKVTWAHETTHGINNDIRNSKGRGINAFYVLNDKAAVIAEPRTTIRRVASTIPPVLRGFSYQLYLVQQAGDWNNEPLYLMDEWTAYANGAECAIEIDKDRVASDLISSHNFNVYCLYLAKCIKEDCPDYDDKQFKAYLKWGIERVFDLSKNSGFLTSYRIEKQKVVIIHIHKKIKNKETKDHFFLTEADLNVESYLNKVRQAREAELLRTFMKEYFGEEWCKKTYGF